MRTLKEINYQLAYFKNSEYRWIRELYIEFENYFDEKLRQSLELDFSENEIRETFLMLLDQLHRILSLNDFYWYEDFTKSFQNIFHNIGHPSNNTDQTFIKERVNNLFGLILFSYYLFILKISKKNVDYYKLKADHLRLKIATEQVEKMNENLKGQNKVYERSTYDKQEDERKKIDNMVKFYVDACERNTTHKPNKEMLVTESGIKFELWRTRLNQEIFLKLLLEEIIKKNNQAKIPQKKEFWQKALVLINNRIDIIGDSYAFKRRSLDPNRSNQDTNYAVSLSDRVEAERIYNEEGIISNDYEKRCDICGDYIDKGFRCDDCKDLFGDNK